MSSFIAVPPAPVSPQGSKVAVDGWYPETDCNAMRDALRLGEIITHPRLVAAIQSGLITVTGELRAWRAQQEAAGHANLAAVSGEDKIGGEARLVVLFTRAVRMMAAAELVELHRDISATNDGVGREESQLQTAADYRRLGTWAIRDMLGTTRVAVEMI
jgi:hypothetical protein